MTGVTGAVLIGLGSNLGDRAAVIHAAYAALQRIPGTHHWRLSSIIETAAVGMADPDSPDFLNAVAVCDDDGSPMSAADWIVQLHAIERAVGGGARQPATAAGYHARVLDLDLLAHGPDIIDTPGLHVPHPRMHTRRFVLQPLVELAPEWRHPISGRTAVELLAALEPD